MQNLKQKKKQSSNNFKMEESKEYQEAKEIAQKKRLLEESMKEYIASIKSTQHIQKELKVIELDPINREIEITTTKLKENGRK